MRYSQLTIIAIAAIIIIAVIVKMEYEDFEVSMLLAYSVSILVPAYFLIRFEEIRRSSKSIAIISSLATLSAASRIPFAAIPNVQPCTFLILLVGYAFGPLEGAMVGVTTAGLSNMFLGQGPWTFWQMLLWGIIGFSGGYLRKVVPDITPTGMAIVAFFAGIGMGIAMDIFSWITFYGAGNSLEKLILVMTYGLPFNLAHGIGNIVFAVSLTRPLLRIFERFRSRFWFEQLSYKDARPEPAI